MSQFQCPLCGKYNSYARFDPSSFDDDVYGADFVGLGRGKGFRISSRYSLLDDTHHLELIGARCRRILKFTEGVEPPPPGTVEELLRINKDWAAWGADARKAIAERDAEILRLGSEVNALKEQLDQSGPSVFAAETEQLRKENRRWQTAYTNLEANSTAKDAKIQNLNAAVQDIKRENTTLHEELEQVDDEDVYLAEMEELLERINDSSNTDYDNLSDAVDWLLES